MLNLNRRSFISLSGLSVGALAVGVGTLPLTGCSAVSKTTLAGLAQTLGNAVANLATLLGNTSLASQITGYTTALVNAIKTWVSGSPTANIIQIISDLEDAINLIPVTPEIQALILLALGTIQGILAFFPNQSVASAVAARTKAPAVKLAKVPHSSSIFKLTWNSLVPADLSGAVIP